MDFVEIPERKPLQDIDHGIVDVILAVSFDWMELYNRLQISGRTLPASRHDDHCYEHMIYRMASAACFFDRTFAGRVRRTLDCVYGDTVVKLNGMDMRSLFAEIKNFPNWTKKEYAGWLWAMATDPREGVEKLLRCLMRLTVNHYFRSYSFKE